MNTTNNTENDTKEVNPIVDFLQSVVIAIAICIIIYIFIATPNQIEGVSMEPNFYNGEIILTNKLTQWLGGTDFGKSIGLDYNRGDIIVFQKPGFDDFIKRVIAKAGDTIEIRKGGVYVNGERVNEGFLESGTITNGASFIPDGEVKTVPEGHYFVMGDNRDESHDSRYIDIGFVDRNWMKGKVILRYLPLNRFTVIR
jgi:signal peptidase I